MKLGILLHIVLLALLQVLPHECAAVIYPSAKDTLVAGEEISFDWNESEIYKTQLLYSTDNGISWNEISAPTKHSGVRFGVPFFENSFIRFKSISVGIKPIQFILEIPNAHSSEIRSIELSPDGSEFVTSGKDGRVVVWDATFFRPKDSAIFGAKTTYYATYFHSRDSILVAEDNSVVLWDRQTGSRTTYGRSNLRDIARCVVAHPTEGFFAVASYDGRAYLFSKDSSSPVRVFENADTASVYRARFSPDGKYLLVAGSNGEVNIWDWRTGTRLRKLVGHGTQGGQNLLVWSCDVSPDGKMVITGGVDRTARLWSFADGKELLRVAKHANHLRVSRFHPKYSVFMTASLDSTLCQWDIEDGQQIGPTLVDSGRILCAEYSARGDTIYSGGRSNSICIWKNFQFVHDTAEWQCRVLYPATITAPTLELKTSELGNFEFAFQTDERVPDGRKSCAGVAFDAIVPAGSLILRAGDAKQIRQGSQFDTIAVESQSGKAEGVLASFSAVAIPAHTESGALKIENFRLLGNDNFRIKAIDGYLSRNSDKNYDHFDAGPNPAGDFIILKIYADSDGFYRVDLVNLIAVRIGTVFDKYLTKGYYEIDVDTKFNASGWYMLRLLAPSYTADAKVMFVH